MTDADQLHRYLSTLFAHAPAVALIEVRFRTADGMGHTFHPAGEVAAVSATIEALTPRTDVYVGVLPRHRRGGGRRDVETHGHALWVDCDTAASARALAAFSPAPSMVVRSGTDENRHGYWLLSEPADIHDIEDANHRLALTLDADPTCAEPARILRPPSLNHKRQPPAPVELERCTATAYHRLADVVGHLPQTPRHQTDHSPRVTDDPLLHLAPRVYVERLTGQRVSRTGKVSCPFHDDDSPSLHVYADPAAGWFCFGCRQGGSVYDFAARLWGLSTRGPDFVAVADTLSQVFGPDDVDAY
jgi:hypothetical protein